MSPEPVNIFSRRIDPRGVIDVLKESGLEVDVDGPEDDWREATVTLPGRGLLRRKARLVVGHDSEYYDGDDWPKQVFGMRNYFANFPETPRKADVLNAIGTFRFALSFPQCDLEIEGNDERLPLVYAICRHLDGVLFTPSSLRDAEGRVLIDAGGNEDPQAVLPKMPPVVNLVDIEANEDAPETTGDEEDDWEPNPPTPERVARRALALGAVSGRAFLELQREELDDPERIRHELLEWVEALGLGDELEPDEWKVIQRPVGTLDERGLIDSMWRVEGLAVLAWALGWHELPPYDQLVDVNTLFPAVGLRDPERASELLSSATLRDEEERSAMLEHLLFFHWRVRNYSLRPEPMDFVEFSQNCWWGSFDISRFRVIDNDLALGENSIHNASDDDRSRAQSTAAERHLAINWIRGNSEVYSKTDTST